MSLNRYAHLVAFALDHPWAVTPDMLRIVANILGERLAGVGPNPLAIEQAVALRKDRDGLPQPQRGGGIALIAAHGELAPRANFMTEASGGTSFESLTRQVNAADRDSTIKTIVIDCDSPGGSSAGAPEFAALLREVRSRKAVVVQSHHLCASAAFWFASNATKFHLTPSSLVGSVGVYSIHHDLTEALSKLGVKRTLISAGKFKSECVDGQPMSEEQLAHRTEQVNRVYDKFVGDVARGRGVSVATVKGGYGEGRLVDAEQAMEQGMADKICTLDETLDRLLPAGTSTSERAALHSADTSQEPSQATDQDRQRDVQWQARIERDLLELALS